MGGRPGRGRAVDSSQSSCQRGPGEHGEGRRFLYLRYRGEMGGPNRINEKSKSRVKNGTEPPPNPPTSVGGPPTVTNLHTHLPPV